MVDNPVLFPPMSALSFPINKSTLFGTFLRHVPDPDVNLSIKPRGKGVGGGNWSEGRATHSPWQPLPAWAAALISLKTTPRSRAIVAVTHVDTSTQPLTPTPPPPLPAQQLCSSASHRHNGRVHRPHATSKTDRAFPPSFSTLIVTLRPAGSISELL